ncbi:hypothetical protein M0802_007531 [Mischocyttarus mexicanus]|nr:hypothetical protein M0802_007531 [Mischocyttarus mexicanus]
MRWGRIGVEGEIGFVGIGKTGKAAERYVEFIRKRIRIYTKVSVYLTLSLERAHPYDSHHQLIYRIKHKGGLQQKEEEIFDKKVESSWVKYTFKYNTVWFIDQATEVKPSEGKQRGGPGKPRQTQAALIVTNDRALIGRFVIRRRI